MFYFYPYLAYLPYFRRNYYWDSTYQQMLEKMHMFRSFLDSIPKSRSEMVNDLSPESVVLPPYAADPDLSSMSSDTASGSRMTGRSFDEYDVGSASSASSVPLSRAMTDSEIEYERYKRMRTRRLSDPWYDLKVAHDAFPPDYLVSLNRYRSSSPEIIEDTYTSTRKLLRNEELLNKMTTFFDEECRVFTPDDPGLLALEEALESLDLKFLEDNR